MPQPQLIRSRDQVTFNWDGLTADAVEGGPVAIDLVPQPGRSMQSIEELVVIAVYSWALADADDQARPPDDNRFGWWADTLTDPPAPVGSRLWTLARGPITPGVLLDARVLLEQALAFVVEIGAAARVDVHTYRTRAEPSRRWSLGITIQVYASLDRGHPLDQLRHPHLWLDPEVN